MPGKVCCNFLFLLLCIIFLLDFGSAGLSLLLWRRYLSVVPRTMVLRACHAGKAKRGRRDMGTSGNLGTNADAVFVRLCLNRSIPVSYTRCRETSQL
jgi:hypothetical protein